MDQPRIAIVARGSATDGLGHHMRARALAEAFQSLGIAPRVYLLGGESGPALFRHTTLDHIACADDQAAAAGIAEYRPTVVVFDTLRLSAPAFRTIRQTGCRTVSLSPVFDQLAGVDCLFHRTIHEDPAWAATAPFPTVIKGLDYTIVSERCRRIPRRLYRAHLAQSPLSLAISMGGADAPNRTLDILNALKDAACSLLIWVALGEAYTHSYEALVKAVGGTKHEVILVKSNESMWRVLQSACLVICSAGMTTYEAACVGLPTINLPLHPDRNYLIRELEERGACRVYTGDPAGYARMRQQVEHWEAHRDEMLAMHDTATRLVRPDGARRVARAILGKRH
jgi:spore coat polysaccharide biosynthesis predicted glycosyltransferase SpsG